MSDTINNTVLRLFGELGKAADKLKRLSQLSKAEFLGNFESVDSAKYNFIVAIEAAVDICNHLIAERKLGTPADYADVFRILGKAGAFEAKLVEKLVNMVKFRNRLVHIYWEVDEERLYGILRGELDDLAQFESAVHNFLKEER